MGSDMIVTMQEASANGTTLFGMNHHDSSATRHALHLVRGQMHDAGEEIHLGMLELPQARQTFTVLGMQPIGAWKLTLMGGVEPPMVMTDVVGLKSSMYWAAKLPAFTCCVEATTWLMIKLGLNHAAPTTEPELMGTKVKF